MAENKKYKATINADGQEIAVISSGDANDYISLTDIAKYKSDEPNDVIRNWMRGKDTIEFLGLWEQLNNPDFKPIEFNGFRNAAGANAFTMSPSKWIKGTNAIGIISRSGRYGGTYAHKVRLNLPHGYRRNLSCILLKIINGLNLMKIVVYH